MGKITPNDAIQLWRNGVEFSHAWFEFADDNARQSFIDAPSVKAQNGRRIMMVVDLWAKLGSGELFAFGDCVSPDISDGPVLIPGHIFEFPPPPKTGEGDDIEVSCHRYDRVKVCRNDPDTVQCKQPGFKPISTIPVEIAQPLIKRPSGRKGVYAMTRIVLAYLFESPANQEQSPERLLRSFIEEFERRFPFATFQTPTPCLRTLRNHLNKFLQESAGTGKN